MSSIWSKLINLAGNITGILGVPNGGTGLSSGTSGGVPYFDSTSTMASSALLTNHGVIVGAGAGAAPKALSVGTAGQLLVGVTGADPAFGSTVSAATTFSGGAVFGNGASNLNWYEEGVWTPTVTMGTSQGSAAVSVLGGDGTAKFTRIGRTVTFQGFLRFIKGTGTGTVTFGGLPYASANAFFVFATLTDAGITPPANSAGPIAYSHSAAQIAVEFQSTTGSGSTTVAATHCSTNWDVIITGTYSV